MLLSLYTSTKLVVGPDILGEILFVVTVGFDWGLGRVPIPIIRGGQVYGCSQYYQSTFRTKRQMGDSMTGRDTIGSKLLS